MTRNVYYDWEFLEDGHTIVPISIGMVDDTGDELYLINRDAVTPSRRRSSPYRRIRRHTFLMAHVVPHLPQGYGDTRRHMPSRWLCNMYDPRVVSRAELAAQVREFLTGTPGARRDPDLQLWAWYGAYDHVTLAWLWGPMSGFPRGIPMWTNDLQQEYRRRGQPAGLPEQPDGQHNALADARHLKVRAEWLAALPAG